MNRYSRRTFIKHSMSAAIGIALLNPFKQLLALFPTDFIYPSWNELVEYARWCPNVHNLQPHKLKIISATEAELYYDPSRLLPVGDPGAIFVTVAMGIFVEHLSIAAGAHGVKVEILEIFDPVTTYANTLTLFAKLELGPADVKETIDRSLITKRRTSRLHYDGKPIQSNVLDEIKSQATAFDHEFYCTQDINLVNFIVDLNQKTLFEDLESKPDRDELNKLFRYTQEQAESTKDGLWARCMGFSGSLMKSVFTHHERWSKGLRKKMLQKFYQSSFKRTATIGLFSGSFTDTKDWVQAGRMLARNWLLITKAGAYIQPFGSLITNKGAYQQITEKFDALTGNNTLWMIFRIGYSDEPARSYRLSTNEIIIT